MPENNKQTDFNTIPEQGMLTLSDPQWRSIEAIDEDLKTLGIPIVPFLTF